MRDSLPLAGVLCSVTCIEQASLNGDESVVVLTFSCQTISNRNEDLYVRFQETVAMAVYYRYCFRVCHGYMVRLDPDEGAIFRMRIIHCFIPAPKTALVHEPKVRERSQGRTRDIFQVPSLEIRKRIKDNGKN